MMKRIVLIAFVLLLTVGFIGGLKITHDYFAYKEAARSNNIEVLQSYLQSSSKNSYRTKIIIRLEELRWEATNTIDTIKAYESFLKEYPYSSHALKASRKVEEKAWEKVVIDNNQESFKAFAAKFPDSPLADEALQKSQDFIVIISEVGPAKLSNMAPPLIGVIAEIKPQWHTVTVDINQQESIIAIFKDGIETKLMAIGWLGWEGLSQETSGELKMMSGGLDMLRVNDKTQKAYCVSLPNNTAIQKVKFDKNKNGHINAVLIFKGDAHDLIALRVFNSLVSIPDQTETKTRNMIDQADN